MSEFDRRIEDMLGDGLLAADLDIIQVNLGLRCNQECVHCHLEASPRRTEIMSWPLLAQVIEVAGIVKPKLVDLTGGSPELNPHFSEFVEALHKNGHTVQSRTNLTVLLEHGMEDLPDFLARNRVRLVGSLPCYLEESVCAQRGTASYSKSIDALKCLNAVGYGIEPDLPLSLVHNPQGPSLPPNQDELEADYKRELDERFGVAFTGLLTIANMPIGRFGRVVSSQGQMDDYMALLKDSFNPRTLEGLMCRHQISIGWDGTLFDCDFNLALGLSVNHGAPDHIKRFSEQKLLHRRIVTGDHCFVCTAGSGSSCSGALVE